MTTTRDLACGPPLWEPVPDVTRVQFLKDVSFFKATSPEARLVAVRLKEGHTEEIASVHRRTIYGSPLVAICFRDGHELVQSAFSVKLLP